MFYVLVYVTLCSFHSSIAIILIGKRELVALLNLSSWFLVMVKWLFFAVPWSCLRFVIVVFPDHTHLPFWVLCVLASSDAQTRLRAERSLVRVPLPANTKYGC